VDGTPVGVVSDLWRFPVKSFGGEQARRAFVGPFGILGDRRQAVLDASGQVVTVRRARAMLGYRARALDADEGGAVRVALPEGGEVAWDDPALAASLSAALRQPVTLAHSAMGVHDAAPVHLVTTASLAAAGGWLDGEIDRRRFRANLIVETEAGRAFEEAGWMGAALAFGDGGPVLQVVSPTERCAVTTFDPDTMERDPRVLAALTRERENLFGVYARVRRPGWVAVGDDVRLLGEGTGSPAP
jgi:uncharacterized protein